MFNGVLLGDTFSTICIHDLLRQRTSNIDRYITDADYADDLALLANTCAQAESLLYSRMQTSEGTDLHVNAFFIWNLSILLKVAGL